ncbi:DNA polymerase [Aeromonas phage PVN03]|uniref:DNA polymerase n=1 Tax=Aeromonas phage PVN03 TaxID=2822864 RepID=A0AAE7RI09_9CAUD|nr:DNA polymerase [Aeromonas phage PVN03]QTQ06821.1 DNA polymerase [Aeromonas phage PVN03]QTQ06952.1 DNA polymerase [Aeromonas phage PVN05]
MVNYLLEHPDPNNMFAADIETTGLLEDLYTQDDPQLHNFGCKALDGREFLFSQAYNVLSDRACEDIRPISELQAFLDTGPCLIMHNGMCYDGEALIFFGYDISKVKMLDTLYLAWYLEPLRNRYGLAEYGEEFGIPKPVIDDWQNLSQEEYNRRVMQDCRIQLQLWKRLYAMLMRLYDNIEKDAWKALNHVCVIKARHLRNQQRTKWTVDVPAAQSLSERLELDKAERFKELIEVMPRMPVWKTKKRCEKPWKMNGALSSHGEGWLKFCMLYGVDFESHQEYTYQDGTVEGNPNSPQQVKDWLFSLGWEPETWEYKRDKDTGEERKIPQINVKHTGGELDPGIERLIEDHQELQRLKGLGIVKHRIGIVNGWIRDHIDGKVIARAAGFTNTLRLRHAEVVNVPSARVPYGHELRSLLIAHDDNHQLLGSDLSSLEDRCKHHYQLPLDPEYVKSQQTEGYDPHMRIARMGGLCTIEDEEFYIACELDQVEMTDENKARYKKLKPIRGKGKPINYGCQYGQRPAGIARSAKMPLAMAETLFNAYWELNWSINKIAESTEVKSANGCNWQRNPVSGIWYYLKTNKDRFSTLCQGTGAYAFDIWVEQIFQICEERWNREPLLNGQFHDEVILTVRKGEKMEALWREVVTTAIARANVILGMRREIDCDIQFDTCYAGIH